MFYDFITKYTNIFVKKNVRSFCKKSTKNIGVFEIFKFEILTKYKLTMSLVLLKLGRLQEYLLPGNLDWHSTNQLCQSHTVEMPFNVDPD